MQSGSYHWFGIGSVSYYCDDVLQKLNKSKAIERKFDEMQSN